MLVSPRRNHRSSWTMDFVCTFLVVSSGKAPREIEAHLVAEHRQRAGAGAVVLAVTVVAHVAHEIEVDVAWWDSSVPPRKPSVGSRRAA